EVLADLADLVAIESVSADPDRAGEVDRCAGEVARLLAEAGGEDVVVVRAGTGKPAVIARFPGPPDAPTVCLYAHHDVQPEGDPAGWTSPPFEVVQRESRIYG